MMEKADEFITLFNENNKIAPPPRKIQKELVFEAGEESLSAVLDAGEAGEGSSSGVLDAGEGAEQKSSAVLKKRAAPSQTFKIKKKVVYFFLISQTQMCICLCLFVVFLLHKSHIGVSQHRNVINVDKEVSPCVHFYCCDSFIFIVVFACCLNGASHKRGSSQETEVASSSSAAQVLQDSPFVVFFGCQL